MPIGQRRAAVLAAARAVFARVGPAAATIEMVARRAGVSRQAVYELFGNKNALFGAVLDEMAAELARELGPPAEADPEMDDAAWFRRNFSRAVDYFGTHPEALALLKEMERGPDRRIFEKFTRLGDEYAHSVHRRWAERGVDLGRMPRMFIVLTLAMLSGLERVPWGEERPDPATLIDLLAEFSAGGVDAMTPEVISRLGRPEFP